MPGQLDGKVALVTGGASGIGRATALTFAREGTKLVIADMNEEGGQQTVHMITEQGGEAIFVTTDVTQATAVAAVISKSGGDLWKTEVCAQQGWDFGLRHWAFRGKSHSHPQPQRRVVVAMNLSLHSALGSPSDAKERSRSKHYEET